MNTANIRKKLLALLMAAALLAGLSLSGYADIADPDNPDGNITYVEENEQKDVTEPDPTDTPEPTPTPTPKPTAPNIKLFTTKTVFSLLRSP